MSQASHSCSTIQKAFDWRVTSQCKFVRRLCSMTKNQQSVGPLGIKMEIPVNIKLRNEKGRTECIMTQRSVAWPLLRVTFVWLAKVTAVVAASVFAFGQTQMEPSRDQGNLARYVWQARKSGKTSAVVPYPIVEYAELESLNDALSHTSLTLAELVASETTHDKNDIVTWRKYRALEQWSRQPYMRPEAFPENLLRHRCCRWRRTSF